MPHNNARPQKQPANADRPFPWRCRRCGNDEVVMGTTRYEAEVRHDGRLHQFTIPDLSLPICRSCGELVFTNAADRQVIDGLRSHLGLLSPQQIHDALSRLGMTQKEAARRLGIAEETLSRWLNESQIQSRAMDNLLRLFFTLPAVRNALSGDPDNPLGQGLLSPVGH